MNTMPIDHRMAKSQNLMAFLNIGLVLIVAALIVRLLRKPKSINDTATKGFAHEHRSSVEQGSSGDQSERSGRHEAGGNRTGDSSDRAERTAAFVQTPETKSIVVNIDELEESAGVVVYDLVPRKRHHHHF
jgi:hypothetical protein